MVAAWPKNFAVDPEAGADFQNIKDITASIRNLRGENKVEPAKLITVSIVAGDKIELLKKEQEIIKRLGRIETLTLVESGAKPEGSIGAVAGGVEIYLQLAGLVDAKAEKKRLTKEIAEMEKYLAGISAKLNNQEFVANAPEAVVAKEQEKLNAAQEKLDKLKEQLNGIKN
jgi:valyl-tRNA synthetase